MPGLALAVADAAVPASAAPPARAAPPVFTKVLREMPFGSWSDWESLFMMQLLSGQRDSASRCSLWGTAEVRRGESARLRGRCRLARDGGPELPYGREDNSHPRIAASSPLLHRV
jgi:hypothetical protein